MAVLEAPPQSSGSPEPGGEGVGRVVGRRCVALLAAGTLLTFLAMGSLWGWRTFASSQGFADVATDMLRDAAVRDVVSDKIVTALEAQDPTAEMAASYRPVMKQVVALVVGTPAFQGVFHSGVRELHAQIARGFQSTVRVEVPDAAQMVKTRLKTTQPNLLASVPDEAFPVVVGLSESTPIDTLVRAASMCGWLAGPFAIAAVVCFLAAVLRAGDRRRAVEAVGWCLIGLGLFVWALLHVLGSIASRSGDTVLQGDAIRAVFWSTTNLLSIQSAIVVTAGAVLAVAGAYSGTTNLQTRGHLVWHGMWRRLEQPAWKGIASIALIAVAIVAMMWPAGTAAVVIRILAFAAFVAGAVGLLDLIGSRRWSSDTVGAGRVKVSTRRLAVGTFGVCLASCALLFFGGLAFVRAVRAPTAKHLSIAETGCNGHQELCDRRIDEVVFAGTHNSMSASNEDFIGANQLGGIRTQLARGVRALALDLHYGFRVDDLVRTDMSRGLGTSEQLTPEQQAAVDRVLALAGVGSEDSEPYFCHVRCEPGALKAEVGFARVHDFLRENPNEVVLIILQDEIDAADAVQVLQKSRLADLAYTWEPGSPFPTLRQMIEARKNVLIMAERGGGAEPWYHAAYGAGGLLQETEYQFDSVEAMSCAPNRSGTAGPLFLLNHWVSTSSPSPLMAARANARSTLLRRAQECAEARGQRPNILLVDFHDRGDLFKVVDALNEVRGDTGPFQAAPEPPAT